MHVAALLKWVLLDHAEPVQVFEETLEEVPATLGVGLLAAAEHDRDLHLVALLEEALDVALLRHIVVVGDLRAQFDLAYVDLLLVLASLLCLLLLLVLVLRVIEEARDGRTGLGSDLDQVEITLLSHLERLLRLDDPDLLAVLVDEADLADTDALVDARLVPLGHPAVKTSRDRH